MKRNVLRSVVHEISYNPSKRFQLFLDIPAKLQPTVLKRLSRHVQRSLVVRLDDADLISILERLDPDEVADILRVLPENKQKKLIEDISQELKNNVSMLLSFDPNTAADLMSLDYVLAEKNETIANVSDKVSIHEKRTGKFPIILVVDDNNFAGFIPGHRLGLSHPKDLAGEHTRKLATIKYSTREEDVLKFFMKHPHSKVAVLGKNKMF